MEKIKIFLSVICSSIMVVFILNATATMYIDENTTFDDDCFENIVITADNVTLNLNGHSVNGQGSDEKGIHINGREGVRVINGYIFNFNYGMYIENSGNIEIRDIHITSCYIDGFRVVDNPDTEDGIVFENCLSTDNNDEGFAIRRSFNIHMDRCESRRNIGDGMDFNDVTDPALYNCKLINNGDHGLELDNCALPYIINCEFHSNGTDGLDFDRNTRAGATRNSTMNSNRKDGLILHNNSVRNYFYRCSGRNNGDEDLTDQCKPHNTFEECSFPENNL